MPFAEVIYEPGSKSVVQYDDEEQLKAALKEQHKRATAGNEGGPGGGPAERVKKVILYNTHPGEYLSDNKVGAAVIKELVDGMAGSGDTVDVYQLIAALRDETSPTFPQDQGRHQSMYKMDGTPMSLDFLDSEGA